MKYIILFFISISYSQDSLDLDLDNIWDEVIWEEITEIGEEYIGEVEQVTAVAGVRGAEAEHEILKFLWYRPARKHKNKAK